MVELQLLNLILQQRSLAPLRLNGVDERYFLTYKAEYQFIEEHQKKYGTVPDKETVLQKFNDFDVLEVNESITYLVEKIQEEYAFTTLVPVIHKIAELVDTDANSAIDYLKEQTEKLANLHPNFKQGYDIIKNSMERKQEFYDRNQMKGLLGIPTGLEALDAITHGWLKEDFITIVGRTNEGKTWVLLFFLVAAWLSGKKVLLYSGEMSKTAIGFRFDTLYKHFSAKGLMGGKDELGSEQEPFGPEDYYQYLEDLKEMETPFIVITPKDIGGERLTIPKLHALIEQHKPDIIGIDQLSLMEDYRRQRGDQERLKFTHISEDLYLTSEKYGKPILSPSQASRASEEDKKSAENTPELHHIAESDGVGQNSTRVIAMKQLDMTLKLTVRKNRYGEKGGELMLVWDIDKGVIKPFMSVDSQGNSTMEKGFGEGVDLF